MGGSLLSPNDGNDSHELVRQGRKAAALSIFAVILSAIAVVVAIISLIRPQPKPIDPASTQSSSTPSLAVANCLSQAIIDYDQKWNALCTDEGQPEFCNAFVGSPKDIQLTQIKDQEQSTCATLYK